MIKAIVNKIMGTKNEKELKAYKKKLIQVNILEPKG